MLLCYWCQVNIGMLAFVGFAAVLSMLNVSLALGLVS